MFQICENPLKRYRRRESPQNFLNWKRRSLEPQRLVAENKRNSWREMAGKVSCNTLMKEVCNVVRRIRRWSPAKINNLEEEGIKYTTTPERYNKKLISSKI